MSPDVNRNYSPPELSALNHPMRIALFDLIKDGINNTPAMAEVLQEDRTNLYHHLTKLEDAGLIESNYNQNRMKVFSIRKRQPGAIQSVTSLDSQREWFTRTQTIVLTPPKDKNAVKKFKKLTKELCNLSGIKFPNDEEILQLQIVTQFQQIVKEKREEIERIKSNTVKD